jgi:amino acid transporter
MCEEVEKPATQVPKAMVYTIIINTIGGLVFLIPIVFVIPDLTLLINLVSGQPVPTIFKFAVGSAGGAFGLLVPLMVLALFCGIGCTTAAARCVWAFSRDGAIPGSKWWKQVNVKLDVPLNAMMLSMVVQIILGVIYFGSSAAFNAFSGVGVICLTLSYAVPIAVSLIGGRTHVKQGEFYFGAIGLVANVVALGMSLPFPNHLTTSPLSLFHPSSQTTNNPTAWSALAIPLFCMPSYLPVTKTSMNYASVVFFAFFVIASLWYFVWGHKHYDGPPVQEDAMLEERRASIRAQSISH